MGENGLLEGHDACAEYLENTVADLLLNPAELDTAAQDILLAEVIPAVTLEDNRMLLTPPTKEDVFQTLKSSNLRAAPGSDGITSLVYRECWDSMGDALTDMVLARFQGDKMPLSMRTSMMVFGAKPKKPHSLKPGDKRRISLLNCDIRRSGKPKVQ